MSHPIRKGLPHDVPLWVDTQKEIYFLTINCQERGREQLIQPEVSRALLESVAFRQEQHLWFAYVFLVMPDHVHALVSFPPNKRTLKGVVSDWKRWTTRNLKIEWQQNFFEHRLRHDESAAQKYDYILNNPVRKGLVQRPEDWPHVRFGGVYIRTERG